MYEILICFLLCGVVIVLLMLVVYAFTDVKEQKKLQAETYAELQKRDEARKRYREMEKKADEQKKKLREGTAADQFNGSIDAMHRLSNKNNNSN